MWSTAWPLARDIALTGTGLWIIVMQALAPRPDGLLLTVAIALTTPSLASHAVTLLSGPSTPEPGQQPSPALSSSRGSSPASPPSDSAKEHP